MTRYLVVDGMRSGTGVRNGVEGGFLSAESLGLSEVLRRRLAAWLERYGEAHARQYANAQELATLDSEGLAIAQLMSDELPDSKIEYFSDGRMAKLALR